MNRKCKKFGVPLILVLVLSGCSSLLESDQPAVKTWWLEPPDFATTAETTGIEDLALVVSAVPGLDSSRIITLDPNAQLNHYSGASWPDHIPQLVSSLLKRSLQQSHQFDSIVEHSVIPGSRCSVELEVQRFYSRLDGQLKTTAVELEMAGQFRCKGARTPLSAKSTVAVSGNRMPDVVAAYQRAIDQVIPELMKQLET